MAGGLSEKETKGVREGGPSRDFRNALLDGDYALSKPLQP